MWCTFYIHKNTEANKNSCRIIRCIIRSIFFQFYVFNIHSIKLQWVHELRLVHEFILIYFCKKKERKEKRNCDWIEITFIYLKSYIEFYLHNGVTRNVIQQQHTVMWQTCDILKSTSRHRRWGNTLFEGVCTDMAPPWHDTCHEHEGFFVNVYVFLC